MSLWKYFKDYLSRVRNFYLGNYDKKDVEMKK